MILLPLFFTTNEVTCWECEIQRKGHCKAKVKLDEDDEFVAALNEYTHSPSQTKIELTKLRASIKRRAENTLDALQQILTGELGGYTRGCSSFPKLDNVRRNTRFQRQNTNYQTPHTERYSRVTSRIPSDICR